MTPPDWGQLGGSLAGEVHVWRWRGPRRDALIDALVAAYLGVPPLALRWCLGAHGKPALVDGTVGINVSHCAGELAVALAGDTEVGVDIEMPRRLRRRSALLLRAFTASEREQLAGADDRSVLQAWAMKEALVKAIGRGIAYGLRNIELDLFTATPRLAGLTGPAGPPSRWQLEALPQTDAALAAVAWSGAPRRIRQWRLEAATTRELAASSMQSRPSRIPLAS